MDDKTDAHSQPDTVVESQANHDAEKAVAEPAPTAPAAPAAPSFPDGGFTAWGCVAGAALVNFCTLGNITGFGVLQAYYSQNQLKGTSQDVISLVGSFELFVLYFVGMFIGRIFDAYGTRYLLLSGTIITVFGHMMLSLSTEYYQIFLSQSIIIGFGNSLCFWPALSAVNHWFLKKRAYAIGCVIGGSSIGGVVFPILYNQLFPKVGFGWTIRVGGFLTLACLIVSNIFVKGRFPKKKMSAEFFEFSAYKDIRYSATTFGAFLLLLGLFTPLFYIQIYGVTHGVDPKLAFYLVSILNGASFFGRILPGFLADFYGRFNLFFISSAASGILMLAFWLNAHTTASIVAFAALYGFFSGAVISLQPAVIAQISPVERIGVRLGMCYGPLSIANLIGTPIAGALFNNYGMSFMPMSVFSGVVVLVGAGFILIARFASDKRLIVKI